MSFQSEAEGAALVLRESISNFLPLPDVAAASQACRAWYRFSTQDRWEERVVASGHVRPADRRRLWWHCAGTHEVAEQWTARLSEEEGQPLDLESSYRVLASRDLQNGQASEIQRDVHRTFPTHPQFSEEGEEGRRRREELREILHAVAAAEPDIGYCQGMNFVAATLLIHLTKASDVFWMLLAIIEACHYRWIFAPGVPLLPLRTYQFSEVVKQHLPRLWRLLRDDHLTMDIFAHQCVLTLFAYTIEPHFLAFVYDVFFYFGWKAIFQIGTGLLASWEPHLLSLTSSGSESLSRALNECKKLRPPGSRGTSEESLRELLQFPVSNQNLREFQASFQLERWELVLRCAAREELQEIPDDTSPSRSELHRARCRRDDWRFGTPLPAGAERSGAVYGGYILNGDAFMTHNSPPWKRLRRRRRRRRQPTGRAATTEGSAASQQDEPHGLPYQRVSPAAAEANPQAQPQPGPDREAEDCQNCAASSPSVQSTTDTAAAQEMGQRQAPQSSSASIFPEPWTIGSGPEVVMVADLKKVNDCLEKYDIDTRKDVDRLRSSLAETDKELAQVLQETEELREEVAEAEAELKEWQNYKAALMESLNTAVMTSPVVLQAPANSTAQRCAPSQQLIQDSPGPAPSTKTNNATNNSSNNSSSSNTATSTTLPSSSSEKSRVGVYQDSVVTQCMEKVRKAESDIFEMNKRLQPLLQENEPVRKLIEDLRRRKARSISDLNDFVAARAVVRDELLRSHLHRLLPSTQPLPAKNQKSMSKSDPGSFGKSSGTGQLGSAPSSQGLGSGPKAATLSAKAAATTTTTTATATAATRATTTTTATTRTAAPTSTTTKTTTTTATSEGCPASAPAPSESLFFGLTSESGSDSDA